MSYSEFDVLIVGSGPNGLAAGITAARSGLNTCIVEAAPIIGGGMRTSELTLPGFKHDNCSAIHPTGYTSPFFKSLPLNDYGLEWIFPEVSVAHPFDDGHASYLTKSIQESAESMGRDAKAYKRLITPIVNIYDDIAPDFFGPFNPLPSNPIDFARFGLLSLTSAKQLTQSKFKDEYAKGLFAGVAGHSVIDLNLISSSAIGVVLSAIAHVSGWPIPKGGSQSIANAMGAYFESLGGTIKTDTNIESSDQIKGAKVVIFDTSVQVMSKVAKDLFPSSYLSKLSKFKAGPGVFKLDLALSEMIPFTAKSAQKASTVHLGSTSKEIIAAEAEVWNGGHPEKPYVLLAQQSNFDESRTPDGRHTGWAYCHVPNGSTEDMSENILSQIERYAPGFQDTILEVNKTNTSDLQAYNQNYNGGDINGGQNTLIQIFGRPLLSSDPYATPAEGIYICSASTPPGGGVHGMGGYHAARSALKKHFGIKLKRDPKKAEWAN